MWSVYWHDGDVGSISGSIRWWWGFSNKWWPQWNRGISTESLRLCSCCRLIEVLRCRQILLVRTLEWGSPRKSLLINWKAHEIGVGGWYLIQLWWLLYAALSAKSLLGMLECPGTQCMMMVDEMDDMDWWMEVVWGLYEESTSHSDWLSVLTRTEYGLIVGVCGNPL